jgi:hypothetical protein
MTDPAAKVMMITVAMMASSAFVGAVSIAIDLPRVLPGMATAAVLSGLTATATLFPRRRRGQR